MKRETGAATSKRSGDNEAGVTGSAVHADPRKRVPERMCGNRWARGKGKHLPFREGALKPSHSHRPPQLK